MFVKKEWIAMLLAGGQGSRLKELTRRTAKPAVTFGGKYKIIDFPLSNCVNSGIDTVGVLTQYQPLALNEYIGNGAAWDLDRTRGGLTVLPPYVQSKRSDWYKGTANAIYQNLNFINKYSPDYVLILSGDHIYKMNYEKMLDAHKRTGAGCTVATVSVAPCEASRFGICNTTSDDRIYQFEEKPKIPKSNRASMGIYIFDTRLLTECLRDDDADATSAHDFGKNIIPKLIEDGKSVYAYSFEGYWRDVGTIGSLWESNMDLLGQRPAFNLSLGDRVYSKNRARAPQYIGRHAKIKNSLISEGCRIFGRVENSVLSGGVTVEEGASVKNSVVMEDTTICRGARLNYCIADCECVIGENAVIGSENGDRDNIIVIEKGTKIPAEKNESEEAG